VIQDVRTLDPLARFRGAEVARQQTDIPAWPQLQYWNDRPCRKHLSLPLNTTGTGQPWQADFSGPTRCSLCGNHGPHLCVLCRDCGVVLRRHQRVGAAWLYFAGRGLLADSVGTGKTAQVAAVLAMMLETGELDDGRAVVICKPAAIGQWARELRRMVPSLRVITSDGTTQQRIHGYLTPWQVSVLSAQTLAPARGPHHSRDGDIQYLTNFRVGTVVYDDVDALRNRSNRAAEAIRELARDVDRAIGVHGTPYQKRLPELYAMLEPVGGAMVFGTERQFSHRFVEERKVFYDTADRNGRQVTRHRMAQVGIKNPEELRRLLAPLVIRRRAEDIESDTSLPAIQLNTVWLDGSPEQRRRYAELKRGVLRRLSDTGDQITRPLAVAHWMHGWQICSGLATLDGGRDDSVKLDWLEYRLSGDLAEEKVVAFINFKPNVQAMSDRLTAAGTGHVIMWGNETGARERDRRLERFRSDPGCRVLLGTTTIEQSLNLQVSRHMVCVDTIPNPARMTQLAGRVRRTGSPFSTVYLHQLLLRGTQEESVLAQLHLEQAGADLVWNERGELFADHSPQEIMRMIAGRAA
jgi:SNF2 family DNA or RNA helicase